MFVSSVDIGSQIKSLVLIILSLIKGQHRLLIPSILGVDIRFVVCLLREAADEGRTISACQKISRKHSCICGTLMHPVTRVSLCRASSALAQLHLLMEQRRSLRL